MKFPLLKILNLGEKETLIYKMLLQQGTLTATEVANSTGIKRPSIYVILERLKEQGLVYEDSAGSAKKFQATSPRNVLDLLKRKRQNFDTDIAKWEVGIPELEALAKKEFQAPKVRFFRGQESMTRVYEEALKGQKWSGIAALESVEDNFEEYLWQIGETLKKGPHIAREIVTDSPIGRAYKRKCEGNALQIKFLPNDMSINSDTIILEEKFFLLSFEEHEMLVLDIESRTMTDSQLVMFDALWESLA